MVIYLHHPKHGQKVACSEAEAVEDEKSGWIRGAPPPAAPQASKPATLTLQRKGA